MQANTHSPFAPKVVARIDFWGAQSRDCDSFYTKVLAQTGDAAFTNPMASSETHMSIRLGDTVPGTLEPNLAPGCTTQ